MSRTTLRATCLAALLALVSACEQGATGPAVVVSVIPETAAVQQGRNQTFAARVTGISNQAVTWSVQEPTGGTITAAGLYTAPPRSGTFHVVAASTVDRTATGVATVEVSESPIIVVTVSPSTAAVPTGGTQAFTAAVTGTADPGVTWSVREASGGTVSSAGLYTAPLTPGTYHVVATSRVDTTSSGTATVEVSSLLTCLLNTPQPVALPAAQVISLGTRAVGETVTFTVPAASGSVTILQQGTEQQAARTVTWSGTTLDNTVVPLTVSVGGTIFFDDNVLPPDDPAEWGSPDGTGIGSIYSSIPTPWTGAMTVPNTTSALNYVGANGGVPSGTWSVVVNDYAAECAAIGAPTCVVGDGTTTYPPGRYDVTVLLKPGPVGATGTMDVNLYLVTDHYTATTAAADASMTRMRATLSTYLSRAGITLGAVNFVDASPAVKARYASGVSVDDLGPCGEVATVLRLAPAGTALSLFLVNSLNSQTGGYTVVGQDGAIPGPATVGGTVASGALLSIANLAFASTPAACQGAIDLVGCGADFTGYVGGHEAGHYLGLYHVSESTGTLFDPVKDTPTCLCSLCAPAAERANCYAGTFTPTTYQVDNADCSKQRIDPANPCGGGDNLMFWLVSGTLSTGTISAQQASIVRANPAVR